MAPARRTRRKLRQAPTHATCSLAYTMQRGYNIQRPHGTRHTTCGSGLFGNAVGSVTAQTQRRPHLARGTQHLLTPGTRHAMAGTQRRTCTATPTARTWPRRRGCKSSTRRARPPTSPVATRCLSTASAWRTTCAATTRARAPPARINARVGRNGMIDQCNVPRGV